MNSLTLMLIIYASDLCTAPYLTGGKARQKSGKSALIKTFHNKWLPKSQQVMTENLAVLFLQGRLVAHRLTLPLPLHQTIK